MTILELRPDRRLVDDNFSGYFLSLTSIPSYSLSLECDVDQVFPSDEQYSYTHTKLFSLHNHLFHDPWFNNSLFYIDKMWKVQKLELNDNTEVVDRVQEVWEIPSNHDRVPGHYPTTMLFPASDLVLVADGAGTLHIVSRQNQPWQVKYGEEVLGKQKSFVVVDSRCETSGPSRLLHTILLHLVTNTTPTTATDNDKDESPKTYTYLEWLTHAEEASGGWSLQCVRQLKGMGLPDYLALEPGCNSIYIASEHPFKFISDTENPVAEETEKNVKEKKGNIYMWQQNAEEVKIWFTFDDRITKQDIKVQINDLNFSLEYKGKTMLQGTLFQNVDNDLTTWTMEQNRLNVICQKLEQGLMWKELLQDNNDGEEILDENVIHQVHERLAHLCSDKQVEGGDVYGSTPAFNMEQLEECDQFGESQVLSRLDATTHLVTHQYSLAGHQWLFSVKLNVENAPALCIRHDVHGCLWQPELTNDSGEWTCTHLRTFPAFGYVSASKQNRKFLLCAVDMSYTVICEANNHIYVYYKDTTTELRNRRSPNNERTQAGKLHCIKMDSADSILGAFSAGSHLYLLTKNKIYQYHIIIS